MNIVSFFKNDPYQKCLPAFCLVIWFVILSFSSTPAFLMADDFGPSVPRGSKSVSSETEGPRGASRHSGPEKKKMIASPRFTDKGNGTARDNLTGLIWLKNANCFGPETWADALSECSKLAHGKCGLTDGSRPGDWRLPTVKELQSLIDFGRYDPALPAGHPFMEVQSSSYWSATAYANDDGYAWHVYTYFGGVFTNIKTGYYYVWPVRGEGQPEG